MERDGKNRLLWKRELRAIFWPEIGSVSQSLFSSRVKDAYRGSDSEDDDTHLLQGDITQADGLPTHGQL